MEVAHSLRVHLKVHLQGVKTKANPNPAAVPKPNVATIWVAKSFPLWQSIILTSLKKHYEVRLQKRKLELEVIFHTGGFIIFNEQLYVFNFISITKTIRKQFLTSFTI